MGEPDLAPEHRRDQRKRVVHVVPVADEGDDRAIEPTEVLADGEDIGEGLAGMLAQGQPVDDRYRRLGGELEHDLVGAGAGHDGIDEPLEVARDVADRLARAHDRVLR
jgi:hypothetical protein